VAVILSAQCTDKLVNKVTRELFKKYKTVDDFASADLSIFSTEISSVTFYNNKAKNIIASAKYLQEKFAGRLPKSIEQMIKLPGVAYKTATVVLGEVYDIWEGIATDTHVRRFALRFELTEHADLTKISKDLEQLFDKRDWKYVNNGLVLYGRYVCPARRHECSEHPLTKLIPSAANIWPKSR
jgi:endonuclease-3